MHLEAPREVPGFEGNKSDLWKTKGFSSPEKYTEYLKVGVEARKAEVEAERLGNGGDMEGSAREANRAMDLRDQQEAMMPSQQDDMDMAA